MAVRYQPPKRRTGLPNTGIGIDNNPLQNFGSSTTVPTNQNLQPNAMTNTAANSRMLDRSQFGVSPQEQQANQLQGSGVPQPRQITGFQPAQGFTGAVERQPPQPQNFQIQQQQPTIGGVSQAPQPQQFQMAQQQPTIGGSALAAPTTPQPRALPDQQPGAQGPQQTGYQTTDIGRQAQDQYAQYAMGQDPMVASAQQRMQRENLNRVAQARRLAHERAVQSGFRPGSAQYEQMMRQGVSDANNASIQALNQFGDFARGRRSDQQRELATVSETEFGRSRDARGEAWSDFNQVVKFLPSDKAQQMFLAGKLGGQDITQSFRDMYQADGTIRPEFRDLTKVELIKKGIGDAVGGMTTNPDTKAAFSSDADRKAYADKFYDENFQNILFPSQTQTGQIQEQKSSVDRVDTFVSSGDASKMEAGDWARMTDTQKQDARSKGYITSFEDSSPTSPWKEDQSISTASAKQKWAASNPLGKPEMKGKVVEKGGQLYIITDPQAISSSKNWELGTYQTRNRILIKAKPVGGGAETTLYESTEYDPD